MKKIFSLCLTFLLVGCASLGGHVTNGTINAIEDSKKAAAERSTEAAIKAAEILYMTKIAKGETIETPFIIDAYLLDVDNMPLAGTVTIITKGTDIIVIAKDLEFGNYVCQYEDEKATCKKK